MITGYEDPDIDAVACAYAYAELLNKKGVDAVAAVFGRPHREAESALKKANAKIKSAEKNVNRFSKVILVDASDLTGISKKIDPNKVVEIIDHRKVHEAEKFPNARTQIEFVGSAATLVAEKFHNEKIDISRESTLLLFSAIASNTINFRAKVTTARDRRMAAWLKKKAKISGKYVHEMFAAKSVLKKPLKAVLMDDYSFHEFGGKKVCTFQLEIVNADDFVRKNAGKVRKIMIEIKKSRRLDFVLLTCIDTERGFNEFVAVDESTEKLISETLGVNFSNGVAKRQGIIMRKEMLPLFRERLSQNHGL